MYLINTEVTRNLMSLQKHVGMTQNALGYMMKGVTAMAHSSISKEDFLDHIMAQIAFTKRKDMMVGKYFHHTATLPSQYAILKSTYFYKIMLLFSNRQ